MFLNGKTLLNTCDNSCTFHHTLIRNLLGIVAQKNMYLNQKIKYTSRKTTREKLMAYTYRSGKIEKEQRFYHPFQPSGAGGLSRGRKKRHVRRAGQAHKAWHPPDTAQSFHLIKTTGLIFDHLFKIGSWVFAQRTDKIFRQFLATYS